MDILETDRLTLREFVPEDVEAMARVLSDPQTMRYYPAPFDRAAVTEWIDRNRGRYAEDGYGLWAMILKSSGELIGDCGLTRQTVGDADEIEIGYHVRRDLWNRGYASEAAQACKSYGFEKLNARRLISLIRPANLASCRVAEKNGMKIWKEVLRADFRHYVYAIGRNEFSKLA
jgi:ribosomal-protein-alanine N-acetyltransferase